MDIKTEWHGGAEFTPHAAALGVAPEAIMAAVKHGSRWTVLFSPDLDADEFRLASAELEEVELGQMKILRGPIDLGTRPMEELLSKIDGILGGEGDA